MKVVYALEDVPKTIKKSIFLAGPTPRGDMSKSWRPEAIEELKKQGFDGVVFSPERDFAKGDYIDQVEWEDECLNIADVILFWVPRSMDMPAFTTNVEYGEWMKSGKCVLGYPEDAEKMRYLSAKGREHLVPESKTIKGVVKDALSKIGEGANRKDGERYVPLIIWDSSSFKNWYDAVKKAGNRLDKAKVLWSFRVGPKKDIVFSWVLHVDLYITKEKRHKTNEFVFSRTDISTVMAYYPADNIADTEILMVKEFRSPCSNTEGFIHELPGGSSKDSSESITEVAVSELREEVGLRVAKDRFKYIQSRQLAATLSAHKSHLFALELTDKEYKAVKANIGKTMGVKSDSEKTYTEVMTLKETFDNDCLDWSTLGMICRVITEKKPEKEKEASDWVGNFIR
jgi:ADP-ribose pyrophosphatase YjhB (NUDIX family)